MPMGCWVGASVAGFLTHYFFVFPWLAIVGWLFLRPGSIPRRSLAVCVASTGALILPWYVFLPGSLDRWRVTSKWLYWKPAHFSRLSAVVELGLQFFKSNGRWASIIAVLAFAFVFVVMLWRLRARLFAWQRLLLWLTLAAALAGPLAFDLIRHTYTVSVPRYAIAALPVTYLLAGLGFTTLRLPLRSILLCLVLVAWVYGDLMMYRARAPWVSIRKLSRAADAQGDPSDVILVHSIPSGVLGIARYANGPAAIASWVGQLGTRRVPSSLQQLIEGRKRILFVKVQTVREPAPEEDWLRVHATVAKEEQFHSGTLIDFRPLNAPTF